MKTKRGLKRILWAFIATLFVVPAVAYGEAKKKEAAPVDTSKIKAKGPEEADVEQIKEKYWARDDESEIGVVQNRLYTNKKKFEIGLLVGSVQGDPFLVNTSLGVSAGYHFTELFSVHATFTKYFVGKSAALTQFEQTVPGQTAATNMAKWSSTAEARWSLLYGKVSLFGKSIIYFDAYLSGGLGAINTETGTNFFVNPGVGQVFHLSQTFGLNIAYKLMWYSETIKSKNPATLGNVLGTHSNFGSSINVGLTIVLDPFPEEKPAAKQPASLK